MQTSYSGKSGVLFHSVSLSDQFANMFDANPPNLEKRATDISVPAQSPASTHTFSVVSQFALKCILWEMFITQAASKKNSDFCVQVCRNSEMADQLLQISVWSLEFGVCDFVILHPTFWILTVSFLPINTHKYPISEMQNIVLCSINNIFQRDKNVPHRLFLMKRMAPLLVVLKIS